MGLRAWIYAMPILHISNQLSTELGVVLRCPFPRQPETAALAARHAAGLFEKVRFCFFLVLLASRWLLYFRENAAFGVFVDISLQQ